MNAAGDGPKWYRLRTIMVLLIVCQEWRHEFTVSFILDKTKLTKNTIFRYNNFFSKKFFFINLKFEIFYLPRPAEKTNWTVIINFPQNCSRRGRKLILIIHHEFSLNWPATTSFDQQWPSLKKLKHKMANILDSPKNAW